MIAAGPWVGEFGWLLFCFQGRLRYISRTEKVVVACRKGEEFLFQDFAAEIISLDLPLFADAYCHESESYRCPEYKDIFGDRKSSDWIKPNQCICDYDWRCGYSDPLDPRFELQDFKQLGRKPKVANGKKFEPPVYDILFHHRSRRYMAQRNWLHWGEFLTLLPKHYKTATIGGAESEMVAGDDLRGMPLPDLCDIMTNARCLVGPSSGPIHLAALCDLDVCTWYGNNPYDERNIARYKKHWNPFGSWVSLIAHDNWQPAADLVATHVKALVDDFDNVIISQSLFSTKPPTLLYTPWRDGPKPPDMPPVNRRIINIRRPGQPYEFGGYA